jgi:hypothetical protein
MQKPLRLLAWLLGFALVTVSVQAQGEAEMEARFIAMLKNSTLTGTWAPIQRSELGQEKKDEGYRIARVEKKDGDQWAIVTLYEFRGRQVEYPMPATVKFAGDTAVLILNNVRAGQGQANWSARVMFHDDVYTGRWWETNNREHGGTVAGTITRAEAGKTAP